MSTRIPADSLTTTRRSSCIFVGNIPYNATDKDVLKVVQHAGSVIELRIGYDKEGNAPKGYAFVEYRSPMSALCALRNLHNIEFRGRSLRVDFVDQELRNTITLPLDLRSCLSSTVQQKLIEQSSEDIVCTPVYEDNETFPNIDIPPIDKKTSMPDKQSRNYLLKKAKKLTLLEVIENEELNQKDLFTPVKRSRAAIFKVLKKRIPSQSRLLTLSSKLRQPDIAESVLQGIPLSNELFNDFSVTTDSSESESESVCPTDNIPTVRKFCAPGELPDHPEGCPVGAKLSPADRAILDRLKPESISIVMQSLSNWLDQDFSAMESLTQYPQLLRGLTYLAGKVVDSAETK